MCEAAWNSSSVTLSNAFYDYHAAGAGLRGAT